ncbi:MAG: hypothetical protein RDU20_16735 [Desulfomonilaceae bacterium]|nr:hypothetical protein [Desulfomonilaceae bacterium]
MSKFATASIPMIVVLAALCFASPRSACASDGFDEYAYQTCITYCYANFRPSRSPADHASCVQRCQRLYGKDRYDPSPRKKRGYDHDSPLFGINP